MKRKNILFGSLTGLMISFPIAVVMYLGQQAFDAPFAPFEIFEWITTALPGKIVTSGIDLLNSVLVFLSLDEAAAAKTSERILAIGLFSILGAAIGALCFYLLDMPKINNKPLAAALTALAAGIPLIAISMAKEGLTAYVVWLAVLFLVWGLALYGVHRQGFAAELIEQTGNIQLPEKAAVQRISRREFMIYLGGTSAAITLVGAGLGRILEEDQAADLPIEVDMSVLPNAGDPVVPVPGTRPELTPVNEHYSVFLGLNPPEVDLGSWQLPVTGLVERPAVLTMDDLLNKYEARHQYVTLRCISGRVGTNLIGTVLWSGVSLQEVLAGVGVQDEGRYLYLTCADGYYETINLDLVNSDPRIMLAYAWNGESLPVEHGYPLRIWIPDVYGMKQPKWITGIEVVSNFIDGYWVERGWDIFARVNATSVIDTVDVESIIEKDGQKFVPVGGIAYAGERGISKVELKVDDGEWQEAQLRRPLSETTWVIWRFEWPYQPGSHTFSVRCFEADGTPQKVKKSPPHPRGATGIHSVEVDI